MRNRNSIEKKGEGKEQSRREAERRGDDKRWARTRCEGQRISKDEECRGLDERGSAQEEKA